MRDGGRRGGISQGDERGTRGKRPTITSSLNIIFSEFGATIGTYPKVAVGLSEVVFVKTFWRTLKCIRGPAQIEQLKAPGWSYLTVGSVGCVVVKVMRERSSVAFRETQIRTRLFKLKGGKPIRRRCRAI
jgi:hypothetical protein